MDTGRDIGEDYMVAGSEPDYKKLFEDREKELADVKALLNTTNGNLKLAEGRSNVLELKYNHLKKLVGEFKKAKERDWDGSRKVSKTEEDDLWDKIMQAINESGAVVANKIPNL